MITKDQIKQAALARGFKLSNDAGDDLKPYVYEFARDMIALAQKVRPLVWARLDHFDTWIAPGIDYDYIIPIAGDFYHLHYGDELPCSSNSIDELKKAAQADFNRRVLENLTHGVADEN